MIIPAYNEGNSIVSVTESCLSSLQDFEFEIIVVNDGSNDGTELKIRLALADRHQNVKVINHTRNLGKGAAIRSGLSVAGKTVVVIQDADLELDPREIPLLVDSLQKANADIALGSRFLGRGANSMKPSHIFGNRFLCLVFWLLNGRYFSDILTGYKVFRTSVMKRASLTANRFEIEAELLSSLSPRSLKIIEVPVTYRARLGSEAKLTGADGVRILFYMIRYRLRRIFGNGARGH